jgi:hypothetical protein
MTPAAPAFDESAPVGGELTEYDRTHIKLYMRLLDAAADGADWTEAVEVLFGIDPVREPDRAKRVHDSHLARARWMTQSGYRQLLNPHYRGIRNPRLVLSGTETGLNLKRHKRKLACCRFRGHEDKIVTKETEIGHGKTEVHEGVQV